MAYFGLINDNFQIHNSYNVNDEFKGIMKAIYLDLVQDLLYSGRAIAQAVSRRLPTVAARVQTRVWSCGIL
jgi:hypothetical protein